MKQIIFTTILFLVFSFSDFAQSETSSCPKIDVSGGGFVKSGEPMSFTVNISEDAKPVNLEYIWTVSKGKIVNGQGSQTITVDTAGLQDTGITATVEIKGLPQNCPNAFSEYSFGDPAPSPLLIDAFGKLPDGQVRAMITNLYLKLGNEPNSQGYISNYGTDKEIAVSERQIQKAIDVLKFDASRVTIVRGGANPNGGVWTKIYNVPLGADNPQP